MNLHRLTRRDVVTVAGGIVLGAAACSRSQQPEGIATAPPAETAPDGSTTQAASSQSSASQSSASSSAHPLPPRGPGADVTHGPRDRAAIALTFHGAGDVGILRRMLAEFAEAGARVTVLAIGQWLAGAPEVARLVLDGGHDLGNHTWSHRTMPSLPAAGVRTEVARAAAELRRLTGTNGTWFRPSGTPRSTPAIRAAAVAAGYGACLAYDVDTLDYRDPGPDAIVRAFGAGVRPGSIVSLHLGHPGTLAAMPRLLSITHDRGLAAVTASDLLGSR